MTGSLVRSGSGDNDRHALRASSLNAKHERFAQELAKGGSASAAYIAAGFRPHASNASRLSRNDRVRHRVEELQATSAERAELSIQWVLTGLRGNFDRAMQHRAVLGQDGQPTGEYRYDGAVANKCLELIGRHLGMFVDRREIRFGLLDNLSAPERDHLRQAISSELVRRAAIEDEDG